LVWSGKIFGRMSRRFNNMSTIFVLPSSKGLGAKKALRQYQGNSLTALETRR
jgi:hypothetical protein